LVHRTGSGFTTHGGSHRNSCSIHPLGPLYDLDQLAKNSVPVAALVYTDDVFVERNLSFASAQQVNNLQIWESDAWHHDGIGEAGAEIFRHLHDMINRS